MTTCSYPAYRVAQSEWLDAVPEHWGEGMLRWLSRRYAGGTPDKAREDYWTDGTIPWLNSGSVNQGTIREPSAFITEDAFANSSARWVPAGALVMALAGQGKTKGMVAQLALPSTCNQSMAAIVPDAELGARYLYWWLSSNYQNLRNMAGGDNRDGLNLELLGNVGCPIPPLEEQIAIAAFLDQETGKIDALVEAQRRLIELLNEKRQAVISHAVTKGLDPAAPMKDSGFEWLGEVPAHWEVTALKRNCSLIKDGTHLPPPRVDEGVPLLSVRNLQRGRFSYLDDDSQISVDDYDKLARPFVPEVDDVLLAIVGATLGKSALVPEGMGKFHIQRSLALFRTNLTMNPGWLCHIFHSSGFQKLLWQHVGFSAQPGIYLGALAGFQVPVPPMAEQELLLDALATETGKLGMLIDQAEAAIALLQERRSALITAAVTGKIDVRGLVSPQEVAA